MKRLLSFVRGNVLTVVSILICIVSLVGLVFIHMKGAALRDEAAARKADQDKIRSFNNTSVRFPPEKPDGEPRQILITANQAAIDGLKSAYAQMQSEYDGIYKYAVTWNKENQTVMREGLFPEPEATFAAYSARDFYKAAFARMFEKFSPSAQDIYPQLDAAGPPGTDAIKAAAARAEDEYLRRTLLPGQDVNSLDQVQKAQLAKERLDAKIRFLMEQAKSIHIYAETDPAAKAGYPFEIMDWAYETTQPTAEDLWEGQMGLWIQQDIVRAIVLTNQVNRTDTNVTNMPIKRLLKIDVLPDYVGITGNGGMSNDGTAQAGGMAMGGAAGGFMPPGGPMGPMGPMGPGMPPGPGGPGAPAGAPAAGGAAPAAAANPNEKLPDDFGIAHTGRRSNGIYDVRHAWVSIIIDAKEMPKLFDNLAKTNFLTVLKMVVRNVDEYSDLQQGYIYGSEDCVRADILIESVWLRDWTAQLMPPSVRQTLGIASASQGGAPSYNMTAP